MNMAGIWPFNKKKKSRGIKRTKYVENVVKYERKKDMKNPKESDEDAHINNATFNDALKVLSDKK